MRDAASLKRTLPGKPVPTGELHPHLVAIGEAILHEVTTKRLGASALAGMVSAWEAATEDPALPQEPLNWRVEKIRAKMLNHTEFLDLCREDPIIGYVAATQRQSDAMDRSKDAVAQRSHYLQEAFTALPLREIANRIREYGYNVDHNHIKYLKDHPAASHAQPGDNAA